MQNQHFLGLRLPGGGVAKIGQVLREVLLLPPFSWMSPAVVVRVLMFDGRTLAWEMGENPVLLAGRRVGTGKLIAVEVPDSFVLIRAISLPEVSLSNISDAMALEAMTSSPFASDDLVWGYSLRTVRDKPFQVCLVLSSRKQVENVIRTRTEGLTSKLAAEAWVFSPDGSPVILNGFGEKVRERRVMWIRRAGYGLLLTALCLAGMAALTPLAQFRMRALEAVTAFEVEKVKTEPLAKKRASYLESLERFGEISQLTADRVDPLWTMNEITRLLPDDTHVMTLHVSGKKIVITGQTANASVLMKYLSSQDGVLNVTAPTAAVRIPSLSKDSFGLELTLQSALKPESVTAPLAVSAASSAASAPQISAGASAALPSAAASGAVAIPAASASKVMR